jgi:hypothetical protein
MQRTMSAIAPAQTRYATGARGPRELATFAGRRKIPPPTVTLKIEAARPHEPSARMSDDSADELVIRDRGTKSDTQAG